MILGIDIGTSSVKAVAVSEDGAVLWSAVEDLPPVVVEDGLVEYVAEIWYEVTAELIKNFTAIHKPSKLSLCIGGQAPSIVPISKEGKPLSRAILWMDGRASKQAEKLRQITGEGVDSFTAESKLLWIKENLPKIYEKTHCFLHCFDFVTYRLTGEVSVGLLDDNYYTWESIPYWVPEHLESAGFDLDKLPRPRLVGDRVSTVRPEIAEKLGIPRDTEVFQGTADFAQSIVGIGSVEPSVSMDHGGTSQGFDLCWHSPLRPAYREFNCVKHVVKGYWNISGVMNTTGAALKWLKNNFYPPGTSYTVIDREAERCKPAQIVVLPYFQGERTPVWNPKARGVFFGVKLTHERGDFARAIMEATAYGLRRIMEAVTRAGGVVSEVRVAGGQANSRVWNQIKADVLGVDVHRPKISECSPLGAAIIAAVGQKLFKDYREAAETIVKIEETFKPNPEYKHVYDQAYMKYVELYESVKDLFD